jgi:NADPH:quinone reductase-like Zn-dependent oxidoreductase
MSVHKAVVYDKPGEISTRIIEVETPKPGPGEILVNMYVKSMITLKFASRIDNNKPQYALRNLSF